VFIDLGQSDGVSKCFIDGAGGEVMAADLVGSRVLRELSGWENILPDPFFVGVGVFTVEGVRKVDKTVALLEVLLVESFHAVQMALEGVLEKIW